MCETYKIIELQDSDAKTKEEVLGQIAEELDFPEYCGQNLDAFNDCLSEVRTPTIIRITREGSAFRVAWVKAVYEIAADISQWNNSVRVEIVTGEDHSTGQKRKQNLYWIGNRSGNMELIELMAKRRSIRKYTGEEIPEEKLNRILQAALLAPTGRGKRPWEFYVVRDKAVLQKLSEAKQHAAALIAGCDAAVAVVADSEVSDTWIEDSSIALAYMDLMATEQGVGSCWVQMRMRKDEGGGDAEQNVLGLLGLTDPYRLVGVMALGVPGETKAPHSPDEFRWEKVHR